MGLFMYVYEYIIVNIFFLIYIGSSEDFKNILDILNIDE